MWKDLTCQWQFIIERGQKCAFTIKHEKKYSMRKTTILASLSIVEIVGGTGESINLHSNYLYSSIVNIPRNNIAIIKDFLPNLESLHLPQFLALLIYGEQ